MSGRRSVRLGELAREIAAGGRLPDVVVESGEQRVLSHKSRWCAEYFRQVRPENADAVKDIIGVPDAVAARARPTAVAERPAPSSQGGAALALPARTVAAGALRSVAVPDGERAAVRALAREATRGFVYGHTAAVAHLRGLIDEYFMVRTPILFIPLLNEVVVQDGGVLIIPRSTYVLWANRIRLYGTGAIICNGPTTFDCQSFEGNL